MNFEDYCKTTTTTACGQLCGKKTCHWYTAGTLRNYINSGRRSCRRPMHSFHFLPNYNSISVYQVSRYLVRFWSGTSLFVTTLCTADPSTVQLSKVGQIVVLQNRDTHYKLIIAFSAFMTSSLTPCLWSDNA